MKKTLIITVEFPPTVGGISTYVEDMARVLDPTNVVVLAPSDAKAKEKDVEVLYKIIRTRFYLPPFLWPRWLALLIHTRRIVKEERIERILVHHALPVGYVAWCMKKLFHIPYLIFSHGTDLLMATKTQWKKKRMAGVCADAEHIIFNSKSLEKRFLEAFPESKGKTLVLYPCPEYDLLQPTSQEDLNPLRHQFALEGKKVVLSVSRLDDGKGFERLIPIVAEVLRYVPNLVWIIVGDGPKRQSIIEEIQKKYLQNVVRFMGAVPHRDLKPYYYLADVFVLLTHPYKGKEEGLGLVFLEASATGRAIVAGRSGGVEEAVVHGETGLVVDSGNVTEATQAIVSLLTDTSRAEQLGREAKKYIQEHFLWEEQIRKLDPWIQ